MQNQPDRAQAKPYLTAQTIWPANASFFVLLLVAGCQAGSPAAGAGGSSKGGSSAAGGAQAGGSEGTTTSSGRGGAGGTDGASAVGGSATSGGAGGSAAAGTGGSGGAGGSAGNSAGAGGRTGGNTGTAGTAAGGSGGSGGATSTAAAAGTYYVSPNGTGTSCTKDAPCSITQAQTTVRAAAGSASGDIVVELADGIYRLTAPLVFTEADSAANGHKISWQAAASAHPVLSGGKQITGWAVSDSAKNIWKASAPGTFATRQLYVDGKLAIRARTEVGRSSLSFNGTGINGVPSSVSSAAQPSRVEFHAVGSWTDRYSPVQSFSGGSATMVQPAWKNNSTGWDTIPSSFRGSTTWFENAYEFLDSPGEWYLDTTAGALYYIPLAGQDMSKADVELPQLELLLAVGGTLASPAHDITFQGLTFSHTSWLNPNTSDGWADQQTGTYIHGDGKDDGYPNGYPGNFEATRSMWRQMPGAVQVSAANNITFMRDRFIGLGSIGLGIGNDDNAHKTGVGLAADTINVTGCVFTQVAASGIIIGGVRANAHHPSDPKMTDQNIAISNCLIHDIGLDYRDAAAILLTYGTSCTIAHNEVYNLPYSGINVGYGWGSNDDGGSKEYQGRGLYQFQPIYQTPTTNKNNQITANYIHDNMQLMNDGGAFYQLGAGPGTVFSKNHVTAPAHSAGTNYGTYSDEGSRYYTFSQNVFDGWGFWATTNCNNNNNTGNITYKDNWTGSTGGGILGQSGSSRACPASYTNSGTTYQGNPANVTVPSLVSTWPAGECGDIVSNSSEATSSANAQAVAKAAGLEAAYADLKTGP